MGGEGEVDGRWGKRERAYVYKGTKRVNKVDGYFFLGRLELKQRRYSGSDTRDDLRIHIPVVQVVHSEQRQVS